MGIEHRLKNQKENNLWKCPYCGCVEELATSISNTKSAECSECNEESVPYDHLATWEDFWEYCQSLKHL